MKYKGIKRNILELICSCCTAIVYLLFYGFSTSPFFSITYNDSLVYILLGKYLKDGMMMYKDFFEHKGPIIFFIECIGSFIKEGRIGAFIIQTFFMTFTIWGLFRLAKLFCDTRKSIICVAISFLFLNIYFEGGNLTEEFCLPVIIVSLYLMVKWLKGEALKYSNKHPIIYGMAFAFCAFIRLTNALPICIFVLVTIVVLIKNKRWIDIIKSTVSFVIGAIIVLTPIVIYCIYNNIVYDMLYSTFLYNISYVSKGASSFSQDINLMNMLYLLPLAMVTIIGIVGWIKDEFRYLSIALFLSGVLGIILQLSGRFYPHYLIMWVPVILIGVSILINNYIQLWKKDTILKCTIASAGLVIVIIGIKNISLAKGIIELKNDNSYEALGYEAEEIAKLIPKSDRDRVLGYNANMIFYLKTDINPCYKYYANQDWLSLSDKKAERDIENYLKKGNIHYLVTGKKIKKEKTVQANFKLVKVTKNYNLYQNKKRISK